MRIDPEIMLGGYAAADSSITIRHGESVITFIVDRRTITLYAMKFSDYALAYEEQN